MTLFSSSKVVGIFRGFSEGGLEFHADLVLPYRAEYQHLPMHGQFLLVQVADENEAVLGRIASLRSDGNLVTPEGEDYSIRMVIEGHTFPEDLKQQYLKYRVNIRVLGVLRKAEEDGIVFVPSHRRLPHVGSPVAFPDDELLRQIAGHYEEGADLGFLAMGEFIWAGNYSRDERLKKEDWMRLQDPPIIIRFPVKSLVSRRTFVFARAGFGKSNLMKLLFSELYKGEAPFVEKRGGRKAPVGTIIFDRDGEYFWPDDKGRPGLADVPGLKDRLVVFTSREAPSPFYGSFVAGKVKLDIRRLPAATVVSIALSSERQDQQNVRKIKGLPQDKWIRLVDLIYDKRNSAKIEDIKSLLGLDEAGSDAEAVAARSNMTHIVTTLHDPRSRLLDALMAALKDGKICVVDVSQLSGESALILSGLILQHIFDYNQEQFTAKTPQTVPVIAVLEEAQSVLGQGNTSGNAPYVTWVKEGRKYDLGAVMITQQPGSIPDELLSQGDNWFIFHLLSAGDLKAVQRANAHYSEDLLSSLLNEPIAGHCIFWSSVGGKPYPLPVRVLSFENLYSRLDQDYDRKAEDTYASLLRQRIEELPVAGALEENLATDNESTSGFEGREDYFAGVRARCLELLKRDSEFIESLEKYGMIPWGMVKGLIKKHLQNLDPMIHDPEGIAYNMVREVIVELFGEEGNGWTTERKGEKNTLFVVLTQEGRRRLLGEKG
ncbi:DUF87 domain-containing protein [Moorellaceae bacterium AZ2]